MYSITLHIDADSYESEAETPLTRERIESIARELNEFLTTQAGYAGYEITTTQGS